MKSIEELKTYYNDTLYPDITELERNRKKVVKKVILLIILLSVIATGSIVLIITAYRIVGFIALFLIIFLFIFLLTQSTRNYTSRFKEVVIRNIVKFIDENLEYSPDRCIHKQEYMSSKIFTRNPDRYLGNDLIEGKLDKTALRFSEVHSQYRTRNSKGHSQWHTIFKGIFFIADFNKNFKGETFVLPDFAERYFGGWVGKLFQKWNPGRAELVKMEDPDFEKQFVVYSNDQVEARYILSTSLMRRILDYKENTNKKIFLSFINNNVCVAISYHKNLFEPRLFKSLFDFEVIKEYYEDMLLALMIVEELNLNTRIWGKQ